jgi:phenylacetate-CoA ligase
LFYNKIYRAFRASPYSLRKILYVIPIEYRLGGKDFTIMYEFLKRSDQWTPEQFRNYQKTQLQQLLEHAVKHVPFYSNITLTSPDPFTNLEKFPIIDKQTIQQKKSSFLADNISKKNVYTLATGGTSGNPLEFYLDKSVYGKEWAFVMTGWKRVGFKPGDKVVSFRGVEFKRKKNIFWQDNPIYNMLEMSPFHLNDQNLPKYVEKIKRYKPKYIHGYPSAITILARYVEEEVKHFPPIKAVLAISENTYSEQRELMERAFNTRLFSFYGMSERVILAPECEYDTRYHSFPEYGITELVDTNGDPVGEGERGELVGTGFLNYCMPFIRYRTEDTAILSKQECKCGRNQIMLEQLIGRGSKEFIIGKSGTKIPFNALYITLHSDVFSNIVRFQFYQKKLGEITIRIVPKPEFSELDKKNFIKSIFQRVGDDLHVEIEVVENIELTHRGKSRLLIQEIPY